MTTELDTTETRDGGPASRGDIAFEIAGEIAGRNFSPGDRAALRRMDPDNPDAAAFWRLLASKDQLGSPLLERKWALILNGIALMTPTISRETGGRSAHDGATPVGRALFLGGDTQRAKGFYSETRFNRLLTARGSMLRILLARMFRMLAAADVSFNWREMAQFILNEDYEERAEAARRRMARDYYRAEWQNSGESTNEQVVDLKEV